MIVHEKVFSTERPNNVEFDEYHVYVHSKIKEATEEEKTSNGFDANTVLYASTVTEYTKEEYTAGLKLEGNSVSVEPGVVEEAGIGAEIFNDYRPREYSTKRKVLSGNVASGDYSRAEGGATTAIGNYSHAGGYGTITWGDCSHAGGSGTSSLGMGSLTMGVNTTAFGEGSIALGLSTFPAMSKVIGIHDIDEVFSTWISPIVSDIPRADFSLAYGGGTFVGGINCLAYGQGAFSCGYACAAIGDYSHASGHYAIAEGTSSHAGGHKVKANGNYSHASGYETEAKAHQFVAGKYNTPVEGCNDRENQSDSESLFVIGYGSPIATANAFRVSGDGKCYGAHEFIGSGADFAEYFEWLDGNPNNEDRRGRIVTLDGDKIRFATAEDDYLLGVVSGSGCFIGNSQSEDWQGKYLKDVFGKIIVKEVEIPEETVEEKTVVAGEDGNPVEHIETKVIPAHTVQQLAVNPDYNPEQEYVSREFRKEWSAVGFHGQIVVVDDGTCKVNSYCKPSVDGIATSAESGYRVMTRIDDTHIKVLVK